METPNRCKADVPKINPKTNNRGLAAAGTSIPWAVPWKKPKIPTKIIILFVGFFGFFHGTAHGIEVPAAANPLLFLLGFIFGTTALHLFGVAIGYFSIKTTFSSIMLRLVGIFFAIYGIYILSQTV